MREDQQLKSRIEKLVDFWKAKHEKEGIKGAYEPFTQKIKSNRIGLILDFLSQLQDALEPDIIDEPNKHVFKGCEITLADVLERPTGIEITANDFMLIQLSLESHINTLQNRFINEEQFIHPAKRYEGVLDKIKALNELPENTFLLFKKSDANG